MAPPRLRIPLLEHDPAEEPVFTAANLLEAARIRKGLPKVTVPAGCLLDFDGELVQHLAETGMAIEETGWPCFHTRLFRWRAGGAEYGVIGGTIGAPYAVLVAEELFALGCRALVSMGQALGKPVVCLAHVTNTMATRTEDFEKGGDAGLADSLSVCVAVLEAALDHAGRRTAS